jgi:hypothetical protein
VTGDPRGLDRDAAGDAAGGAAGVLVGLVDLEPVRAELRRGELVDLVAVLEVEDLQRVPPATGADGETNSGQDRCVGWGRDLWPLSAPDADWLADPPVAWPRTEPAGSNEMTTDFEVGVLLYSAVESNGTSGLVSG